MSFQIRREGFSKVDKREELGCRNRVAAGDRCRGFGKGPRISLAKCIQTDREGNLIPGEDSSEEQETPGGPQMGLGWRHGGEARAAGLRGMRSLAECFGRGQVSMEDSQADFIGCQALLHPSGLTIVFLRVIFVLNPLSSSPQRAPVFLPGPDWPSEAVLEHRQGPVVTRGWHHDGTWGRKWGPERGRKSWSELLAPTQLG